jgi:hypothetical protein
LSGGFNKRVRFAVDKEAGDSPETRGEEEPEGAGQEKIENKNWAGDSEPVETRKQTEVNELTESNDKSSINGQLDTNHQAALGAQIPLLDKISAVVHPHLETLSHTRQFGPGYLSPIVKAAPVYPNSINLPSWTGPFDFTGLPVHIRKEIYTHLLTTPSLICLRQNRSPGSHSASAYLTPSDRRLLPGISFALTQSHVRGLKSRFPRSTPYTNVGILRVSKAIYAEAKPVLYGGNTFEFANLTPETAPPVEGFRVPMFGRGVPRLVRNVAVGAKSLYGFRYLVAENGYREMKNMYRGLESLTLLLELDTLERGLGKKLARRELEKWDAYVERLFSVLKLELWGWAGLTKALPSWIQMRVVFPGDAYLTDEQEKDEKRGNVKKGVHEAFGRFQMSGLK